MDPLSLLRQYTRGRHLKHVVKHEDRITFGDQYSYPKNTLTAFKSSRGENYTLETVLHFITIHSGSRASAAEYVQSCTKHAVPPVVIQDRKVGSSTIQSTSASTLLCRLLEGASDIRCFSRH